MNFCQYSDDEIFAIAKPIMECMKDGTNRKAYKLFSCHFSSRMLEIIGHAKFLEQVEKNIPELGELSTQQILGYVRRDSGVSVVYKQNTTKKKGELLGQLFLDEENGRVRVFDACIY